MDYYDMSYRSEDMHYFDVYVPGIAEVWETCLWPSLAQIAQYMVTFFIWNLAFRATSQTFDIPRPCQHIASIVCGIALSHFTLGLDFMYSLIFTAIEYILLLAVTRANLKNYGVILTVFCLTTLVIGEILDSSVLTWHRMRGTQMIAAVKIISIGFDIDRNKIRRLPNFLQFWGYVLCPGNVVMGPWCSYNDYLQIFQRSKFSVKWIFQLALNVTLSVFFLLASNCLITSYIPDLNFTWGSAYKAALSYRCSHYFICFLSHCTMLMAGFGEIRTNRKKSNILGYSITKPWVIEVPRSLVDVVVYWNLSMHYWLKTYIFLQLKPHGIFKAVISTYIISSLLHGVNVQLAAVLLTLGFATYAEYTMRKKVAEVFDACVLAHPCVDCSHRYGNKNFMVIAFNFSFGMLAMFHLAYLGVMFDGPVDQQEMSHSIKHITERWGNLDYLSHWLILLTFCFSALI